MLDIGLDFAILDRDDIETPSNVGNIVVYSAVYAVASLHQLPSSCDLFATFAELLNHSGSRKL